MPADEHVLSWWTTFDRSFTVIFPVIPYNFSYKSLLAHLFDLRHQHTVAECPSFFAVSQTANYKGYWTNHLRGQSNVIQFIWSFFLTHTHTRPQLKKVIDFLLLIQFVWFYNGFVGFCFLNWSSTSLYYFICLHKKVAEQYHDFIKYFANSF